MDFILKHYQLILLLIGAAVFAFIGFLKLDRKEKIKKVKAWLLQLVMLIEKEYGPGTGKLKLSAAYDKFCERFPWLVNVIPYDTFSNMVDDALVQMRDLLATNEAIANFVKGRGN